MNVHEMDYRVSYADTDRMGVVYYANYLILFERGRTELLRDKGMRYLDWEAKGVFLPAVEAECRYLAPAQYDDLLRVRTLVKEVGAASIVFTYEIVNADTGKLLVTGRTKHPIVNKQWRPIRVPAELKEVFKSS